MIVRWLVLVIKIKPSSLVTTIETLCMFPGAFLNILAYSLVHYEDNEGKK